MNIFKKKFYIFPVEAKDIIEASLILNASARAMFYEHAPKALIEQVAVYLDSYQKDSKELRRKIWKHLEEYF